jgi:hypothetical protein
MMNRYVVATVALALSLAGCGGASHVTTVQPQRATQADAEKNLQAAITSLNVSHHRKISPTAAVYATDSIGVQDGSRVAVFPASSRVTRDASGLTVIDSESGQQFRFSASAAVHTELGGGRVYVERGSAIPIWARSSNARLVAR